MNRIDTASITIGLAALGFAIVLVLSIGIPAGIIQLVLAAILILAGVVGVLSTLSKPNRK